MTEKHGTLELRTGIYRQLFVAGLLLSCCIILHPFEGQPEDLEQEEGDRRTVPAFV